MTGRFYVPEFKKRGFSQNEKQILAYFQVGKTEQLKSEL